MERVKPLESPVLTLVLDDGANGLNGRSLRRERLLPLALRASSEEPSAVAEQAPVGRAFTLDREARDRRRDEVDAR